MNIGLRRGVSMRVEKTVKNIKVAMLYQIAILLFNFIDRKIFLTILGVDFLGLNGLFNNIITMLSLAELGIGTAVIYNLYQPLERENKEEIAALMQLYKKAYQGIGIAIAAIGAILALALPIFIKEPIYDMNYIRLVYFIFLMGTVFTYFTGYKRSLLYADQKNYLLLLGDMTANTIGVITKISILVIFKNYIVYTTIHMIFKLLPNMWAAYKVNQIYPYINEVKAKLQPQKLAQIKNNIKDLFIHKLAQFLVLSTDNLIISSFIGLEAVGLLSSYNMIMVALMGFIGQGSEGIQASLGNLVAAESKDKVKDIYDKYTFASFWVGSFCVVALLCLVQPFIALWLGEDYLLNNNIVIIIVINFFLWTLTRPTWQMMTVSGMFKEDKINALVEIVVNLVLSLLLVQKLGILGVLIGTMISYLVAWIMKSHLLYKRFFKKPFLSYYGKIVIYSLIVAVEVIITYIICKKISLSNTYIRFGVQMIICVVVPNLINYILFCKTKEFDYFKKVVKDAMMGIIERLKTEAAMQTIQKVLFIIMAVILFVLPIDAMEVPRGTMIGKLAAITIFISTGLYIFYLLFISSICSSKAKRGVWIYIAFGGILTLISLISKDMAGIKATLLMFLVLNTGIAFAYIDTEKIGKSIYILDVGIITYIIIMASYYMKLETKPRSYRFLFTNPNYLGLFSVLMISICFLAYGIINRKRYFIYPMAYVWLAFLSRSRTAILALGAFLITYLVWRLITKYKGAYYAFFGLLIVGIIAVTLYYPLFNKASVFETVNKQVVEVTGKGFFSGRERLWLESVELISKKPVLGYGMGATLEGLTEGELSTHNVYLQLLLQGGFVLLISFVILISWVWGKLYKVQDNRIAQVTASCLVAMLVIGTFELYLLGQSISQGNIQWFIIGIGLSPALYNK